MRKNYLGKLSAAVMLLIAGLSFTSCNEFFEWLIDNPVEVTQNEEGTTITLTTTGASMTVSSSSDISNLLSEVKADIASKGSSEYVVTINSSNLQTSGSDNTISVPKVVGSNINLTFNEVVSTSTPLTLKASETTSTTSTTAVNEVTVTMPSGTSGVSLNIEMPETSVTLKAYSGTVVYNEVAATTATNTLIIESGVTIKTLVWKGGNIIVKDGAKIETLGAEGDDKNDKFQVSPWGTSLYKAKDNNTYRVFKNTLDGDYYIPENVKVCKGDLATNTSYDDANNIRINKLIIADGASAIINYQIAAEAVEGEGNAKIYISNHWLDEDDYVVYTVDLAYFTTSIKGITIEPYIAEEYKEKEKKSHLCIYFSGETPTGEHTVAFTNCSFYAKTFFETRVQNWIIKRDEYGNVVTEEVTIYHAIKDNGNGSRLHWYGGDKESILSITGNPDVEVSEGETGGYWTTTEIESVYEPIQFSNYTGILELNSCTIGGSAITSQTDLISSNSEWPEGVTILVKVDGTLYSYN